VTTALAPSSPLTAADRCDRCGAQAYVRVRLVSGGELLFCVHHAKKFDTELKKVAVEIIDESDRLAAAEQAGEFSA
jgi:hypothetical protein